MALFKCKLGDEQGRVFEKEVEADSAEKLKIKLESEGCLVYEISRKSLAAPSFSNLLKPGKVKANDFLVFNQELTALLKAGVPLLAALEVLSEEEENHFFRNILAKVAREVKSGTALSDAMEGTSTVFTKLYVSSIRAGEKSGDITANILRYINYMKVAEALKKKVVTASIYPIILLSVAIVVVLFLLLYVVPSFSQIFLDSGTELPLPTLLLIELTDFVKNYIILFLLLAVFLVFFFFWARKTPRFSRHIDRLKISAPWIGRMVKKYAVAKFSRTLSAVLRSGSPLVSALSLSAATLDNVFLEEKVLNASARVREGETLSKAIEETGLMPKTALKMVMVGESSGALDDMFENVAELFEEDVDRSINVVTSTIEPLMMLSMGIVIAFIVVAMYLPIFKIAGTAQ